MRGKAHRASDINLVEKVEEIIPDEIIDPEEFGELAKDVVTVDGKTKRVKFGSIVERMPLITPEKYDWEIAMEKLTEEKQKYTRKRYPEQFNAKTQKDVTFSDPLPRRTEADEKRDLHTLWRRLDERLYLLVKPRDLQIYHFPSIDRFVGEKMQEACKRSMRKEFSTIFDPFFIANQPMGMWDQDDTDIRVFFFRAQWNHPEVDIRLLLRSEYDDFIWVTKDEIPFFVPPSLAQRTNYFLPRGKY